MIFRVFYAHVHPKMDLNTNEYVYFEAYKNGQFHSIFKDRISYLRYFIAHTSSFVVLALLFPFLLLLLHFVLTQQKQSTDNSSNRSSSSSSASYLICIYSNEILRSMDLLLLLLRSGTTTENDVSQTRETI